MNSPHECPTCNVLIPIDVPNGLCPSCLLRWALETLTGQESSTSSLRENGGFPLSGTDMPEPGGSEDDRTFVDGRDRTQE